MSAEFNKHMGKTIREYINELRITDAKFLLEYSKKMSEYLRLLIEKQTESKLNDICNFNINFNIN